MNKKLAITVLLALTTISLTTLVIAANYVESPPVTVNVKDYTLTISDPSDGTIFDTYTFTGSLTLNGAAVSGKTVTLWVDDGSGYVTTGLTDTTDAMGAYSIDWTPTTSGSYAFKTKAMI